MDYVISLNEAQVKAMEYIALDPYEWIEHAAINRAEEATDAIVKIYLNYKLEKNEPINYSNKNDIVLAAYAEGIVKNVATLNQEAQQKMDELAAKEALNAISPLTDQRD